jgi:2-octaprenyl-6-methoxyphenol hydroxylase
MIPQTDVLIVGGGPIGASLSLLLSDSGKRVTLLEARTAAAADARTLAISHGTALLLDRLGVSVRALGATTIETIHVSQRGGFGRTLIRASEMNVPALGYVVTYGQLGSALDARLSGSSTSVIYGARVAEVGSAADHALAEYEHSGSKTSITASLLVLADGGRSLGAFSGVEAGERDYRQHALVATVSTDPPAAATAYERFTPEGPLALLPQGKDYALVWTVPSGQAERLIAAESADFLRELEEHFGLGAHRFLAVGARVSYPLKLRQTRLTGAKRTVLVGNAAQTLHPVAGQGFNLGMRDVWALARVLRGVAADQLGSPATLARYRAERGWDARGGAAMTDFLVRGFSNDNAWLKAARGAALVALDLLPPGRTWLARKMMFGSRG